MLAEDIDFHQIFKIHPTSMVLLTADLEIVDANEQFLAEVGRELEDVLGHHFFEEFPKMPEDSGGHAVWTALEAAACSGKREHNLLFRMDVEEPGEPGVFVEHYWSSVAQPIRGLSSHVDMIEFSVRDVTPLIAQYRELLARE